MKDLFDELFTESGESRMEPVNDKSTIDRNDGSARKRRKNFTRTSKEEEAAAAILLPNKGFFNELGLTENIKILLKEAASYAETDSLKNYFRGLYLFHLFFLNLKNKNIKAAHYYYQDLQKMFKSPNETDNPENLENPDWLKNKILDDSQDEPSHIPAEIRQAYTRILSLILNSTELMLLGTDLNLSTFPFPPRHYYQVRSFLSRQKALDLLKERKYEPSYKIYTDMLIDRDSVHSTLVHLTRLEFCRGNYDKARFHLAMAWRIRSTSPEYVVNRMIFFIILFKALENEPFDLWLPVLRNNFAGDRFTVFWEMDFVMEMISDQLEKEQIPFLDFILNLVSSGAMLKNQEFIEKWSGIEPLSPEYWPDPDFIPSGHV
jgi:hypothetical protein